MSSINLEREVFASDWTSAMTQAISLFTTHLHTPTNMLEKVCIEMDTNYGWRTERPGKMVTRFYAEYTIREK